MKKLLLAAVALAFAFAISSCCDQSYCPSNMKCRQGQKNGQSRDYQRSQGNTPKDNPRRSESYHDYDQQDEQLQPGQQQERNSRRW